MLRSFGFYGIAFFGIILLRYFLVAGGTYWFFYSPISRSFANPDLPYRSPDRRSIHHDIQLSVLSAGVFALAAALIMSAYGLGI
ncbi:MAG: sterol desaturase family protein, partial [Leptolyngbyaceae cyanobacterium SL_7_1]|nr:sterol desaturase family protein [Leptolyngbyaceae cyanobacterium SL_7_1]